MTGGARPDIPMQTVLFWTAETLYALSTALFFVWFAFRKDRAGRWGWALAAAGLVPHGASLALRWIEVGHGPWSTRYEVLSGEAFLLVAFFVVLTALGPKLRALGVLVAPVAFLAMQQSWGRYWGWDPIETCALVTWIVFGLILHFRVLHHWSGRRMAYLTFVGFAFAVMTMSVVVLIVPTIHNAYMVGK